MKMNTIITLTDIGRVSGLYFDSALESPEDNYYRHVPEHLNERENPELIHIVPTAIEKVTEGEVPILKFKVVTKKTSWIRRLLIGQKKDVEFAEVRKVKVTQVLMTNHDTFYVRESKEEIKKLIKEA